MPWQPSSPHVPTGQWGVQPLAVVACVPLAGLDAPASVPACVDPPPALPDWMTSDSLMSSEHATARQAAQP
jgi:hypothetical protein